MGEAVKSLEPKKVTYQAQRQACPDAGPFLAGVVIYVRASRQRRQGYIQKLPDT